MNGHGLPQSSKSRIGQGDDNAACVGIGARPSNQAFIDQAVDPSSHARTRAEGPGREVGHPQLAARAGQLGQHIEVAKGQASPGDQIGRELAHERGVRPEEGKPGTKAALVHQRVADEVVEDSGRTGF